MNDKEDDGIAHQLSYGRVPSGQGKVRENIFLMSGNFVKNQRKHINNRSQGNVREFYMT